MRKRITWKKDPAGAEAKKTKREELASLPLYVPEPPVSPPDRWDTISVGSAVKFTEPLVPYSTYNRVLPVLTPGSLDEHSHIWGVYVGMTPVKMARSQTSEVVERMYRTFLVGSTLCVIHNPNLVEAM